MTVIHLNPNTTIRINPNEVLSKEAYNYILEKLRKLEEIKRIVGKKESANILVDIKDMVRENEELQKQNEAITAGRLRWKQRYYDCKDRAELANKLEVENKQLKEENAKLRREWKETVEANIGLAELLSEKQMEVERIKKMS